MFVFCSAGGSPGVSTTALGLALTWPSDVLLVDADRTPTLDLQAGYLHAVRVQQRGLSGVLRAYRERSDMAAAVRDNMCELPRAGKDDESISRRCLPGFSTLGSVDVFGAVWAPLLRQVGEFDADALIDAGQIGRHGIPAELVESANRVAVVCRTSLTSLVAARLYTAALAEQVMPGRLGLVLVGPGRPYAEAEVAEQFGLPVWAHIAWDQKAAEDLHEGLPLSSRWRAGGLARSYARASGVLSGLLVDDKRVVGAVHV